MCFGLGCLAEYDLYLNLDSLFWNIAESSMKASSHEKFLSLAGAAHRAATIHTVNPTAPCHGSGLGKSTFGTAFCEVSTALSYTSP